MIIGRGRGDPGLWIPAHLFWDARILPSTANCDELLSEKPPGGAGKDASA